MKDVPIKFRGVSTEDFYGVKAGDTVYGGCNQFRRGKKVTVEIITSDGICYVVQNVAQLCGYDADGNEVYDGDILCDQHGNAYFATMKGFAVTDGDCVPLDFDEKNVPRLLAVRRKD